MIESLVASEMSALCYFNECVERWVTFFTTHIVSSHPSSPSTAVPIELGMSSISQTTTPKYPPRFASSVRVPRNSPVPSSISAIPAVSAPARFLWLKKVQNRDSFTLSKVKKQDCTTTGSINRIGRMERVTQICIQQETCVRFDDLRELSRDANVYGAL